MLVDESGSLGILVRLAIHHVAPVTPNSTDVEQNGLVLSLSFFERLMVPLMPLNRLMHGGTKVRRGGLRKGVCGVLGGLSHGS
jgi:hypothetical protein